MSGAAFILYDPASGALLGSGHCSSAADAALQATPARAVLVLAPDVHPNAVASVDLTGAAPMPVLK